MKQAPHHRLMLRIDLDVYDRIQTLATEGNRNITRQINMLIREAITARDEDKPTSKERSGAVVDLGHVKPRK